MAEHRIFKARFSDIYPLYVQKALRKGRTQDEVDAVILWLTGYTPGGLARQLAQRTDMASFFGQAPRFNPAGAEIKGVVCGVRRLHIVFGGRLRTGNIRRSILCGSFCCCRRQGPGQLQDRRHSADGACGS